MDAGMENGLPSLEIKDIEDIVSDDEDNTLQQATPESISKTLEDVKIAEEDDTPFVHQEIPKTKKKKDLSEKQKAHLVKINEQRREKHRLKKEAEAIVKQRAMEEMEILKEKKKSYKKATKKLDEKEPREKVEEENKTPEDFVPSHKEKMKQKAETEQESEARMFMSFMSNMEKYQQLRADYETEKVKSKPKPKPKPVQPAVEPVSLQIINEPKSNPFDSYFG